MANTFPKTQTGYLGVRLTPDLKARLDFEAKKRHVTTTEIVRASIMHYLGIKPRPVVAK